MLLRMTTLFFLVCSSLFSQNTTTFSFSVSVLDAELGTSIPGASVLDLSTDELIDCGADGFGTFSLPYSPDAVTSLQIAAPGYPDGFRQVRLPSLTSPSQCYPELPWTLCLYLSSTKLYLSPPVGPAGGSRVVMHPTGQLLLEDGGGTRAPDEYLQRIKIVVPPGTLSQQFRVGLTPIATKAAITAFDETIAVHPTQHLAQFRLGLYNLDGTLAASPTFDPPIRIEIGSATYAPWTAMDSSMQLKVKHFDESQFAWDDSGVFDSGYDPETKSTFAELTHFSVFSALNLEPADSLCKWKVFIRPHDCNDPWGIAVEQGAVVNGTGPNSTGEHDMDIDSEHEIDNSGGTTFDAESESALGSFGLKVSVNSRDGSKATISHAVKAKGIKLPEGSDPAYQVEETYTDENGDEQTRMVPGTGNVYLRQLVNHVDFRRYCNGTLHGEPNYIHIVGGFCTDTSGLVPHPGD